MRLSAYISFCRRGSAIMLYLLFGVLTLQAQSITFTKVKKDIRTWQIRNDYGIPDTTFIDTAAVNLPMRDVVNDNSIAWAFNGNFISPMQSKIYFDRSGNGMLSNTGKRVLRL